MTEHSEITKRSSLLSHGLLLLFDMLYATMSLFNLSSSKLKDDRLCSPNYYFSGDESLLPALNKH